MSSDSEIALSWRRLKPQKRLNHLTVQFKSELIFVGQLRRPHPGFLLDSTVYTDEVQGRLPEDVDDILRNGELWHSTVTEAEFSMLAGLLHLSHPGTEQAVKQVIASIDRRDPHRIVNADREVWREAGILTGLLARLQQYGKADQRKTLNDALIFLSAAKAGLTVLTRNVADFDLRMQLAPFGSAVFYEVAARPVKSK